MAKITRQFFFWLVTHCISNSDCCPSSKEMSTGVRQSSTKEFQRSSTKEFQQSSTKEFQQSSTEVQTSQGKFFVQILASLN